LREDKKTAQKSINYTAFTVDASLKYILPFCFQPSQLALFH